MPIVAMPDGTQVQMPDNPDPALLARLKAFQDKSAPPAAPQGAFGQLMDTAKNLYGSFLEPAASLASGAIAKPLSDVAGLAAIPAHAVGLTDVDPATVKAKVRSALTYQPRTEGGQQATNLAGQIGDATIGSVARGAGDYYGGAAKLLGAPQGVQDAFRNGAQELTNQAPGLLGVGGDLSVAKIPKLNEATAQTLQDTHALGIRVTPEYAGMKSNNPLSASNIASVSGSETKMQQALSKYNAQEPVPKVIKQEVGIDPDRPLTQAAIDEQKATGQNVYRAVKQVGRLQSDSQLADEIAQVGQRSAAESAQYGTRVDAQIEALKSRYAPKSYTVDASTGQTALMPTNAAAVVDAVTGLRHDARVGFKSDDPKTVALATAQQQTANALDSFLQRQLQANNNPLAGALAAARTKLAKIHSVEDAFNEANGTVDVKSLAKDLDNGVPLSGGLLALARAYKAFPKVLQDPAKINVGSGSMIDKALQVGGILHGNPLEIAAGAARPLARARINTTGYQEGMVNPQLGTTAQLLNRLRSISTN